MTSLFQPGSAVLSSCGLYRYRLERDLGRDGPTVAILSVNPSTADATIDDQTIRKDMGFGERLGWGRIIKGNKFAWRATDVKALRTARDPIGPDNDAHLEQIMRDADLHIVAWGPLAKLPPPLRRRWRSVAAIGDVVGCRLMCWGTAQDGHPRHPLMLAYATPLIEWERPA
jgi:hypothetical protein